jgi:hypothetical protein
VKMTALKGNFSGVIGWNCSRAVQQQHRDC